jgi:hypothetical protein
VYYHVEVCRNKKYQFTSLVGTRARTAAETRPKIVEFEEKAGEWQK